MELRGSISGFVATINKNRRSQKKSLFPVHVETDTHAHSSSESRRTNFVENARNNIAEPVAIFTYTRLSGCQRNGLFSTIFFCSARTLVVSSSRRQRILARSPRKFLYTGLPSLRRTFLSLSLSFALLDAVLAQLFSKRHYCTAATRHPFIRGWRQMTRCRRTRPPRQPAATSATVPVVVPTSAPPASSVRMTKMRTSPMSLCSDSRCRPRKPWRDSPRARRSSRPVRRHTTRDYLQTTTK